MTLRMVMNWPGPNATLAQVDVFVRAQKPAPEPGAGKLDRAELETKAGLRLLDGDARPVLETVRCEPCRGKGEVACDDCGGRCCTATKCDDCGGKGTITRKVPPHPADRWTRRALARAFGAP